MTENEAIEWIKKIYIDTNQSDRCISLKMAISALMEIQQYRAFEKRLKKIYGDCPGLLEIVVEHLEAHDGVDLPEPIFKARLLTDGEVDKWEAYKQIGTPEEIEKIGKPDEIKALINRLNAVIAAQHDKLTAYMELGTVDELREAMETQRAKKPVWKPFDWEDENDPDPCCYWHCPKCGKVLTDRIPGNNKDFYFHCLSCGQKFDWSEEE